MDIFNFMEQVAEKTSGEYESGQAFDKDGFPCLPKGLIRPSVHSDKEGVRFRLKFLTHGELQFEIIRESFIQLQIKPRKGMSSLLSSFGLYPEVRITDNAFDRDYLIQNCTEQEAQALLIPEVCSLIRSFGSFLRFRVTLKSFILLKNIDMESYTPIDCVEETNRLIMLSYLIYRQGDILMKSASY